MMEREGEGVREGGRRGKRGRRREGVSSSQNPMEVTCTNSHTVRLTPDTHTAFP